MTPPTAAERAEWREQHKKAIWPPDPLSSCSWCADPWPCPTIRLADALDAAEADRERLRGLVKRLEEQPVGERRCLCCPVCFRGSPIVRRHGHYPDCELAAALAGDTGAEGGAP